MKDHQIKITAWYLNVERIYQLIGSQTILENINRINGCTGRSHLLSPEGMARTFIKEELEKWLQGATVPTIGELITKNKVIEQGQLFTVYQDFYGKGLSKFQDIDLLPKGAVAELHNKLSCDESIRLRVPYSPQNIFSVTAWSRLGGHTRLFIFGYIEQKTTNEIIARPYIIGDLHYDIKTTSFLPWAVQRYGEIHPSQIESFKMIQDVIKHEKKPPDINMLKKVPEQKVKSAFAEIIHEGNIPKDWGGEKSDLFSTNVIVEGKLLPTAFLFKGPSKFKPMTVAALGKNGDQIDRLFSEPADLLVLQHCHSVTASVRSTMRAFASRIYDLRFFSIIDGFDTIRILNAYGKI